MQTFKVGDKAVYPGQGVGEVMGIEHKDIAGQRQSFYVLEIMENGPGFSKLLWEFVDGKPKINHFRSSAQIPNETEQSRAMSKELQRRGFKFCGPTIVYAFMQAAGIVNDHAESCFRRRVVAKL